MKDKKRVLVVEDERTMAETIAEGLRRSPVYDFEVAVAESPRDCLAKGFEAGQFDVYVVDLQLTQGERSFFGQKIVAVRAFETPGALTVVYSAYPSVENVVRAIQSGAADFIAKAECPPHQLPARIERLLDEQRRSVERQQKVDALVRQHGREWRQKYAGQVLMLVDGGVAAAGRSRLEAYVRYEEGRAAHSDWPEEPELLEVPTE
jgi:DNA-binding NtrC family response regulator